MRQSGKVIAHWECAPEGDYGMLSGSFFLPGQQVNNIIVPFLSSPNVLDHYSSKLMGQMINHELILPKLWFKINWLSLVFVTATERQAAYFSQNLKSVLYIFSILDTVILTYSKNLELAPNICWEFSSPGERCFGYFSGQGLPQGSLRHMPIK